MANKILDLGGIVSRGVNNWGAGAIKKGLDEVTGTITQSRGRPRQWIKIPAQIIQGSWIEPYIMAAESGVRPPDSVPTVDGQGNFQLAGMPAPVQQKSNFLSNVNWNNILLLVGVALFIKFLFDRPSPQPQHQSSISGGYGCVRSDGKKVCGELV